MIPDIEIWMFAAWFDIKIYFCLNGKHQAHLNVSLRHVWTSPLVAHYITTDVPHLLIYTPCGILLMELIALMWYIGGNRAYIIIMNSVLKIITIALTRDNTYIFVLTLLGILVWLKPIIYLKFSNIIVCNTAQFVLLFI